MHESTTNQGQMTLAQVTRHGIGLPNRCITYGVEGVGKSSFGASAPKPIFLLTRGETGLMTLIDSGRVPETPHLPELMIWQDLLGAVGALANEPHDYRTLVIDTVNGAERLCHEHVCQRDFGGQWGRNGFTAYMTGYVVALADWRLLLEALEQLRSKRKMSILALAHSRVITYKNPEGPDYDRFSPDLHPKTWGLTHKWADMVIFANFAAFVEAKSSDTRGKAKGGTRRVLFTTRTAAFDAKNRHGLPEQIDGGSCSAEMWTNFATALAACRKHHTDVSADGQPATIDVRP